MDIASHRVMNRALIVMNVLQLEAIVRSADLATQRLLNGQDKLDNASFRAEFDHLMNEAFARCDHAPFASLNELRVAYKAALKRSRRERGVPTFSSE